MERCWSITTKNRREADGFSALVSVHRFWRVFDQRYWPSLIRSSPSFRAIEGGVTVKLSLYFSNSSRDVRSGRAPALRPRWCKDLPARSCPPWSGTCLGTAGNGEPELFRSTLPFTFGDLVVRHIADFIAGVFADEVIVCRNARGQDQACKQTGHQYKTCEPAQKPLHHNSPSGIGTRRPAEPVREHYKSKPRLSP